MKWNMQLVFFVQQLLRKWILMNFPLTYYYCSYACIRPLPSTLWNKRAQYSLPKSFCATSSHFLVKDVVINWYVEKLVPIFPWALSIACNAKFLFTTNFTRENMLITRYVLWLVETSICRGDMKSSTELVILIVPILQDFFTIHQMVKWELKLGRQQKMVAHFSVKFPSSAD